MILTATDLTFKLLITFQAMFQVKNMLENKSLVSQLDLIGTILTIMADTIISKYFLQLNLITPADF